MHMYIICTFHIQSGKISVAWRCSDATMDLNNGVKEATMLAIYEAHIVNAKHQKKIYNNAEENHKSLIHFAFFNAKYLLFRRCRRDIHRRRRRRSPVCDWIWVSQRNAKHWKRQQLRIFKLTINGFDWIFFHAVSMTSNSSLAFPFRFHVNAHKLYISIECSNQINTHAVGIHMHVECEIEKNYIPSICIN